MTDDRDGREPGFEVALRGYRTTQVDAWVDEVHHVITSLETERDDARRQAASLQAALDEMRARDGAPDTFGARAERILRMAEHDAHLRRERAESDAADIRELGHAEAERTVAQARDEASRVRADAAQVRDDAERAAARARAALADARRDADLRVDTAASMNEHVQSLRSSIRGEVARLHAALGAELRALDAPLSTDTAPHPVSHPAAQPGAAQAAEPVSGPADEAVDTGTVDTTAIGTAARDTAAPDTADPNTADTATADAADTDTVDTAGPVDPEDDTALDVVAVTDGDRNEPAAVVVALPVQRDHPRTEDATPASGMPAATADRT